MARPPFTLTEDQQRHLTRLLVKIVERYPDDAATNHRPFVHDFLRAVYDVTGQTYSPVIYSRLLGRFAPKRRPSNTTIAKEQKALVEALALEARAARQLDAGADGANEELGVLLRREVAAGFADTMDQVLNAIGAALAPAGSGNASPGFLHDELQQAERTLRELRGQAARLAADLQSTTAERDLLARERASAHALAIQQGERLEALSKELTEIRKFALRAVDDVRGETRMRTEQVAQLERQLQIEKRHTEIFRQAAYARGGSIPKDLQQESKT